MSSPAYLNVTFTFPHGDPRTLYSNSDLLSTASPYFKTLFDSGFSEETSQALPTPVEAPLNTRPRTRPFHDSDDERDEANLCAPPSTPKATYRIEVTESSYITYQAVLHWIHTGLIQFAPLTSMRPPPPPSAIPAALLTSPKSVYRLADFLDLPALKALALAAILSQITATNAIVELTSSVSALYEPLQAALLDYTALNWKMSKKVRDGRIFRRRSWRGTRTCQSHRAGFLRSCSGCCNSVNLWDASVNVNYCAELVKLASGLLDRSLRDLRNCRATYAQICGLATRGHSQLPLLPSSTSILLYSITYGVKGLGGLRAPLRQNELVWGVSGVAACR